MKIIRIAQQRFPIERIPTNNTEYIRTAYLTNTQGGSNKEYTVRVYQYNDGFYSCICYWGKINSTLTRADKYLGDREGAIRTAADVIAQKTAGGYRHQMSVGNAPGRPAEVARPATRNAPTPTPAVSTPPVSTMSPALNDFIRQLTNEGSASMGDYHYTINRNMSDGAWMYVLSEYSLDSDGRSVKVGFNPSLRHIQHFNRSDSLYQAGIWASERAEESETDVNTPAVKDRAPEPTPEPEVEYPDYGLDAEFKNLLGHNNNWYKTAQKS